MSSVSELNKIGNTLDAKKRRLLASGKPRAEVEQLMRPEYEDYWRAQRNYLRSRGIKPP